MYAQRDYRRAAGERPVVITGRIMKSLTFFRAEIERQVEVKCPEKSQPRQEHKAELYGEAILLLLKQRTLRTYAS